MAKKYPPLLPINLEAASMPAYRGNIVPLRWISHIRNEPTKGGAKQSTNFVACFILADIINWHMPRTIRSETTGEILEECRWFAADMLQRNIMQMGDQFNIKESQLRVAQNLLIKYGLIEIELRTVDMWNGMTLGSVPFVIPNFKRIAMMNEMDPKVERMPLFKIGKAKVPIPEQYQKPTPTQPGYRKYGIRRFAALNRPAEDEKPASRGEGVRPAEDEKPASRGEGVRPAEDEKPASRGTYTITTYNNNITPTTLHQQQNDDDDDAGQSSSSSFKKRRTELLARSQADGKNFDDIEQAEEEQRQEQRQRDQMRRLAGLTHYTDYWIRTNVGNEWHDRKTYVGQLSIHKLETLARWFFASDVSDGHRKAHADKGPGFYKKMVKGGDAPSIDYYAGDFEAMIEHHAKLEKGEVYDDPI